MCFRNLCITSFPKFVNMTKNIPFFPFCTLKLCMRVHCPFLKNNPNYVNFFARMISNFVYCASAPPPAFKFSSLNWMFYSLLARWPFAGRASNWQSNKLGCYITMYSPIARSVVLRRRGQTIMDLLGNVFIMLPDGGSPRNGGTVQRANRQCQVCE